MDPNEEIQEADALEEALTQMEGQGQVKGHAPSPELNMAIRFRAAAAEPRLSQVSDQAVEKLLLSRFAQKEEKTSYWKQIFGSSLVGGVIVAVMGIVILLNPNLKQEPTLAQVQDFESLSEAEVLLGQLPADTLIDENLSAAELRENIHEINLTFTETDVTLDADTEVGEFPHTELRDSALEIIDTQLELEEILLARVEPISSARTFNEKVSKWPTTNIGVDFPTHAKAVSTFLKNNRDFNRDMATLARLLLGEL